jgi:hypothetical protein
VDFLFEDAIVLSSESVDELIAVISSLISSLVFLVFEVLLEDFVCPAAFFVAATFLSDSEDELMRKSSRISSVDFLTLVLPIDFCCSAVFLGTVGFANVPTGAAAFGIFFFR